MPIVVDRHSVGHVARTRRDLIGDSIEATVTVTLGAPKLPLVLPPAEMKSGEVVIADIGIPVGRDRSARRAALELLTREQMRPLIQPRAPDAHKGDFGRVLVVAGSMGKAGAAVLCAQGAMRAGAGLVTVAAPRSCQPTIAAHAAEYMTEGLDETPEGTVHFFGRGRRCSASTPTSSSPGLASAAAKA